jgi:ABC-type transport system substrate-binding protein
MTAHRLLLALALAACLAPGRAAPAPATLHVYLSTSESALDPAVASDLSSLMLEENLFDPLLHYDYLARPAALRPNTARALPEVSADGLTYTFHLRPGIYFAPDPAFHGTRRELTAADYVYTLTRLYDPALKSPWLPQFEGKLAGDAALRASFSYARPIAGLQAPDRYTLRIGLNAPDHNFLYYLAMPATGVVAREAVEAYAGQVGNHPVGTGPFMVDSWKHSDRIVLVRNPNTSAVFHAEPGPGASAADRALAAALEAQRLPRVDRVDVRVAEEFQGRMLGFLNGEYDLLEQVPESMRAMVLQGEELKPALAARGVALHRFVPLQTYYLWMNMDDPVLGGYDLAHVALRRAVALAYDSAEDIALLKQHLALRAESPLPPAAAGYDPAYRNPVRYDPALANALLERFGYRQRDPDGFRRDPRGRPLTLIMASEATPAGRLRDEFWRQCLHAVGLRVQFRSDKKSELIKASRLGQLQMFETNWYGDFPDGDNFYQLLYGGNVGRANYARFDLPAYNSRYEAARALPDGPARSKLYFELNQLIAAYNPWVPLTHPVSLDLTQPWLKNYRRHPVEFTQWRYLDVAPH